MPWDSTLPHPVLVINSEEVVARTDFRALFAPFAHSATAGVQAYVIGGATHPAFSDVFLLLPHTINKLTGLGCPARAVIDRVVRATGEFLAAAPVAYDEVFRDADDMAWKHALKGRRRLFRRRAPKDDGMYRALGVPGELALYEL